jgi:hypothetical protein
MFLKHSSDYTRVHVLVESVVVLPFVACAFHVCKKEEGICVCSWTTITRVHHEDALVECGLNVCKSSEVNVFAVEPPLP